MVEFAPADPRAEGRQGGERRLDWSARHTLTWPQRVVVIVIAIALLGAAFVNIVATLIAVAAFFTLAFVVTTTVRLTYVYFGYRARRSDTGRSIAGPHDLPSFTVMVAIYHEAAVVPALLDALAGLRYADDRLEVLLLVEHDDPETRAACEQHLRAGWQIVTVPPGEPRTKPRALNVGLERATGELLTIYDAEDRPEPDQLLKAAAAFRVESPQVAALQARLDFYNSRQNMLTRWFACEYATHFGLYLEGISSFDHALPLGGTSTHFRTAAIREVGGWDAWNVTEDCELGMRLACAGFHARTLDSVTWEEAVPALRGWIRQRSRWVKGFAQTGLVLMRAPLTTGRSMGWRRYAASLAIVPGVAVTLCGQLITWTLFWAYLVLRLSGANVDPIESIFPEPLLSVSAASLLLGNFAILLAFVAGVYERRRFDLVPWALLVPLYWFLLSLGAWKGMLQLVGRPHVWEKTTHGLAKPEPLPSPAADDGGAVTAEVTTLVAVPAAGAPTENGASDRQGPDELITSSEGDLS